MNTGIFDTSVDRLEQPIVAGAVILAARIGGRPRTHAVGTWPARTHPRTGATAVVAAQYGSDPAAPLLAQSHGIEWCRAIGIDDATPRSYIAADAGVTARTIG
jgi:hypothetical protein